MHVRRRGRCPEPGILARLALKKREVVDTRFFRCKSDIPRKVGLVVPPSAEMIPEVADLLTARGLPIEPASAPPYHFTFHYVDSPLPPEHLADGAVIDTGVYRFFVRDGVLAVFDQPFSSINEFAWAFSTTTQTDVVAALRIGEVLDVAFDTLFEQAEHVARFHFPSGLPDSGYGEYGFHAQVDGLSGTGFRVVSSFERGSKLTTSRLPFFMGFRVFGRRANEDGRPLWREMLGQAVREALLQRWAQAILFSAFALESVIDGLLLARLDRAGLGRDYADHVLRVGEKRAELVGLNYLTQRLPTTKSVHKEYEALNAAVFTPRNKLAHGLRSASEMAEADAQAAIREVVRFVWDWDPSHRHLLLPEVPNHDITTLIDPRLTSDVASEAPLHRQ